MRPAAGPGPADIDRRRPPHAGCSLARLLESLPTVAEQYLQLPCLLPGLPLGSGLDRRVDHLVLLAGWSSPLNATDGCDTRREVILSEAVEAPQVTAGCKLTGGSWLSPYDGVTVTDAAGLDHMVPLAEVHDAGGHAWDAARREAYANDQASPLSLFFMVYQF